MKSYIGLSAFPIFHHFGDMTAFMCSWPHLYSTVILGGVSVASDRPRWGQPAHKP